MRKILILNNDLDFGGIQKSLISLLKYLATSDSCEIDLMLWRKDDPLQKMLPPNIQVFFQNYAPSLLSIKREKNLYSQFRLSCQYLKFRLFSSVFKKPWLFYAKTKKKYDVVISYTHNGFPHFFAIDRVSATEKYLWFHHGSYTPETKEKELDRKYYGKYDKIITVSSSNKVMLAEHFSELKDKLVVIPNIIDAFSIIALASENTHQIIKDPCTYNFVTVSRFSREKGLDLAIKTAAELKRQGLNFKWYFVGDGELFLEIKDLAEQNNVSDVCIFEGNKENPYPYFKIADLYIQSSYVEAHPITICEALVLKKMIITTDLPSTREVLQNGKLGILCKPDLDIFTNTILKFLQSTKKQKTLVEEVELYNSKNDTAYNRIRELLKI